MSCDITNIINNFNFFQDGDLYLHDNLCDNLCNITTNYIIDTYDKESNKLPVVPSEEFKEKNMCISNSTSIAISDNIKLANRGAKPYYEFNDTYIINDNTCSICLEKYTNPVITPCNHIFCNNCLYDIYMININKPYMSAINKHKLLSCPLCRNLLIDFNTIPIFFIGMIKTELYNMSKSHTCKKYLFSKLLMHNKITAYDTTELTCKLCNAKTNINNHQHHLEMECPNVIFSCSTCNYKANRDIFIKEHLYKKCNQNFNICKDCCTSYENDVFSFHICPYELISCPRHPTSYIRRKDIMYHF